MVLFAACLLIAISGYLIGSVPFALLIGKLNGIDIRTVGSKNVGATNVTRTVGKWWGRLCFLLDFLKGFAPVFTVKCLACHHPVLTGCHGILFIIAIIAPFIGHIYPIWLKFKGGKGVSTGAGAIFALAPIPMLVTIITWVILFYATRYVSVASVLATAMLPFYALLGNWLNIRPPVETPIIVLLFILAIAIAYKHKSNIQRLCNGTESKFEKTQKK